MGILYELIQNMAGQPRLEQGYFECWIDWRRSALSMLGKDNSENTRRERIWLDIDYTFSVDIWTEPPLEIDFRSLAFDENFGGAFHWEEILG